MCSPSGCAPTLSSLRSLSFWSNKVPESGFAYPFHTTRVGGVEWSGRRDVLAKWLRANAKFTSFSKLLVE